MTTNELSIKLLINTKTNKLCFAEAGSDVVEFLTGILSLPVGTVTSLLAKEGMAGSVGTLLNSAEKLGAKFNSRERNLIPAVSRATLLRLQLLLGAQINVDGDLFLCGGKNSSYTSFPNCGYISTIRCGACPSCGGAMNVSRTLAGNRPLAAEATTPPTPTFTVMDDLSMTPASMSVITLLAQCGVKDLSVLQEKIVKIGQEEALGILAAAFKSKTVLTDVFLPNLPKKNARCKREPPEEVVQI